MSDSKYYPIEGQRPSPSQGPRPKGGLIQAIAHPGNYWPAIIISGQLFIILWGWTFFALNATQPMALSDYLANKARQFPSAVTFIVTLVSTLVSIGSSYLHSHAIRFALTCRLSKPMPLHHLAVGIKIARERTVVSWQFFKWTLVTGMTLGLLGAQTTAWSTLLTPSKISLPIKLSGVELDFSQPKVYQFAADMSNVERLRPDDEVVVTQPVQNSGIAAVQAEFELPGNVVYFNQISFTDTTGGIMPMFLHDYKCALQPRSHYPPRITYDTTAESRHGFGTTYEMVQQGMTVKTTCKPRTPSNLVASSDPVEQKTLDIVIANMNVTCPNGTVNNAQNYMAILPPSDFSQDFNQSPNDGYSVFSGANDVLSSGTNIVAGGVNSALPGDFRARQEVEMPAGKPQNSTVLASTCSLPDHPGGREFVIHAVGGQYQFIGNLSCEMIPMLTTVNVRYSATDTPGRPYTLSVAVTEVIHEQEINEEDFGLTAFKLLDRSFQIGQAWGRNSFGNTVLEILVAGDSSDASMVVGRATEAYLTGIFEFSATLVQAALTYTNNTFLSDELPEDMRHTTQGTLWIETIGWDFRANPPSSEKDSDSPISDTVLVALVLTIPTMVAISAITATIVGVVARRRLPMLEHQERLDSGDFLQVMSITNPHLGLPSLDKSEGDFMQFSKMNKLQVELKEDKRNQIKMVISSGRI